MSKVALVTGAYGFVGRYVAQALSRAGYIVVGIGHGAWDRTEFSKFGISFWHSADVSLEALVSCARQPEVIVHCAGGGSVAFSLEKPFQDYQRTVSSTAAVLEYVRQYSPRSIVIYPSSAAVYGATKESPILEGASLQPVSPYGAHKLMAESLCRSYAKHFGIAVTIVRLFSVYGEGLRKQLLWDACWKVKNGESQFFGTGDEIRDWLHAEDAAALLCMAARHASPACLTANGGTGEGFAVRDILKAIFERSGITKPLSFSGESRAGDPSRYIADVSMASGWGWAPKVGIEEGIGRYTDWFWNSSQ